MRLDSNPLMSTESTDDLPGPVPVALRAPVLEVDGSSWFTDERLARIGEICASLLIQPTTWIDRRKDSVTVLDDTAIRWKNSVDFELPAETECLEPQSQEAGDPLYCAPLFTLPKRPSDYMAFDLEDETGKSLSLLTRRDNSRVSEEVLIAMARQILSADPVPDVVSDLRLIAEGDPTPAKRLARRRLKPLPNDVVSPQWMTLRKHERFCWWALALAESSVVAVLYRGRRSQRKRIRLSYDAGLEVQTRLKLRLGWDPYAILIDVPFIEARSYHFEAQSPSGMRIERAWLTDDEAATAVQGGSFVRRVHLYRRGAQTAGAGAGQLDLRVTAEGFLTGAWFAGLLVVLALATSAYFARNIAANPTSAPALFLLLPGLIASYVGRPDRHALTTRLLSVARLILIGCAFLSFVAGVAVAVSGAGTKDPVQIADRASKLHLVLWPCVGMAVVALLTLSIGVARSSPRIRSVLSRDAACALNARRTQRAFRLTEVARCEPPEMLANAHGDASKCVLEERKRDTTVLELTNLADGRLAISRTRWYGTWIFLVTANDHVGGTRVGVAGHLVARRGVRWLQGLFVQHEEHQIEGSLERYVNRHH